jgi:hypothetical protein
VIYLTQRPVRNYRSTAKPLCWRILAYPHYDFNLLALSVQFHNQPLSQADG